MKVDVKIIKAIADTNRLEILKLLAEGSLCVGALKDKLKISQSAVSQHLRILKEAGLLDSEKHGYWVHYSINEKQVKALSESVEELSRSLLKEKTKTCKQAGCSCDSQSV